MLQIAAVGTISVGVVLVLLLGEIDLSVGAVSGLAAAVMAVLNVKHGWAPVPAICAGLAIGAAIGLLHGFFVTRFGVPSFVVTLAGLLAWQGALLLVLGSTGTVNLSDPTITGLTDTFYGDAIGWVMVVVVVGAYAASRLPRARATRARRAADRRSLAAFRHPAGVRRGRRVRRRARRRRRPRRAARRADLRRRCARSSPSSRRGRRSGATCSPSAATWRPRAAPASASTGRGSPCSCSRRRWPPRAAMLAASRLLAVNQSSGGSDLLLLAIAGPVIGGHQPVRRARHGLARAARRARHRLDLQRHGPARARVVGQVHGHGRRAARRGRDRRHDQGPARTSRGRALARPTHGWEDDHGRSVGRAVVGTHRRTHRRGGAADRRRRDRRRGEPRGRIGAGVRRRARHPARARLLRGAARRPRRRGGLHLAAEPHARRLDRASAARRASTSSARSRSIAGPSRSSGPSTSPSRPGSC